MKLWLSLRLDIDLLEQGFAEDTGLTKHSGRCIYPLWTFKEEFLKEIGAENYKIYSDEFDHYMKDAFGDEDEEFRPMDGKEKEYGFAISRNRKR